MKIAFANISDRRYASAKIFGIANAQNHGLLYLSEVCKSLGMEMKLPDRAELIFFFAFRAVTARQPIVANC